MMAQERERGLKQRQRQTESVERLRACLLGEVVDLGLSVIGFGPLPRSRGDSPVSHMHAHHAVCGVSVYMCVCVVERENE